MPQIVRDILWALLAVVLQWLVFSRLDIQSVYPDVVLIALINIAWNHGRLTGTVAGFVLGLLHDMLLGTWGIQMFVKTLTGFLAGTFLTEKNRYLLSLGQVFLAILLIALVHDGIKVVFYMLESGTRSAYLIWGQWIGAAFYTAIIATLFSVFRSQN
jgi:rod shape-determining protein MreD